MCYQPLFLPFRPSHIKIKGHPRAPAPSMLYPASDIDWQFNSYMIVYMLEFFFLIFIYLFWPCQVLATARGSSIFVAVCGIFTCNMWDLAP